MTTKAYRRIMLKFSGEALLGQYESGIDAAVVAGIAEELAQVVASRVQVGVIIGGGNFCRGAKLNQALVTRVTGDHLGMIATIMNALVMRDVFVHFGMAVKIMSALPIPGIIEGYSCSTANSYLQSGQVVIFAGGTGNPFVTTDSALSLRGIELDADLLLKATNVDGIYSADPKQDPKATFYSKLTYTEVLQKEYAVMDLAAFCLCRDHNMKLRIFNMHKPGALLRILAGADEGTLVY